MKFEDWMIFAIAALAIAALVVAVLMDGSAG